MMSMSLLSWANMALAFMGQVVGPVAGACLIGYFAFHVIQGERGLSAWKKLHREIAQFRALQIKTEASRLYWEHRVGLIRAESLDPDLLDEQTRRMLGYLDSNEVVIVPDPDEKTRPQ